MYNHSIIERGDICYSYSTRYKFVDLQYVKNMLLILVTYNVGMKYMFDFLYSSLHTEKKIL